MSNISVSLRRQIDLSSTTRYLKLCMRAMLVVLSVAIFGNIQTYAQSQQIAGPSDSSLLNEFVPQGQCGPALVYTCDFTIKDLRTGWTSPRVGRLSKLSGTLDPSLPLTSATPLYCNYFLSCTYQPDYVQVNSAMSIPLIKPGVDTIAGGITFLLKVLTTSRASDTQEGDAVTMPNVFSIKTIGPRWALHTAQAAPQGDGSGYDQAPWEPYNYPGNVNIYEDIYYTFTPDGRVRIDKFTPYTTGLIWTSTHYIWEESINDGGWPSTWTNGQQNFFSLGQLILGGDGKPSGIDQFRSLLVYGKALSRAEMVNQENFYHDSRGNLTTDMAPCNTGDWINTDTITTPCGQGGNRQPVPAPPTNVAGFNRGTDSYAPSFVASDNNGQFTFQWAPPSQGPPISTIQDPNGPTPWSPFFPVTPTDYTLYMLTQDLNGTYSCQASLSAANFVPGGRVIAAALGANYPMASLNGPSGIATTTWVNPNPNGFAPTTNITVPTGWQCTQTSTEGATACTQGDSNCDVPDPCPPGSISCATPPSCPEGSSQCSVVTPCVAGVPDCGHAPLQRILFLGDSYTFGRIDPVMSYNTANVHDLTQAFWEQDQSGTNPWEGHPWGGIPGLFKRMTDEVGLNYDVSISARNAATLRGQFLDVDGDIWDLRGNVASQKWDVLVLQENTTAPLPLGKGVNADPLVHTFYAGQFERFVHNGAAQTYHEADVFPGLTVLDTTCPGTTLSHGSCTKLREIPANPNANPNAKVFLLESPARPDMIFPHKITVPDPNTPDGAPVVDTSSAGGDETLFYPSFTAMTQDIHAAYANDIATNPNFTGVIPVGDAFQSAVDKNLVQTTGFYDSNGVFIEPNPDGLMDLWWDDGLHARNYGSYLEALVCFGKITGVDPMLLGSGDLVARDLAISPDQTHLLQEIASAQLGFRTLP